MRIIFRADDLGFSEGINCGIAKAVIEGPISSVGMMTNMDSVEHGYNLIKDVDVCLGQHTNICVGKPLCDPALIPSLVDENGMFCSSKEIRARKDDSIVIEECELEIEAQLSKFVEITGKKPDYFEGHAVFSMNFFKALENVAKRNGLFYCNPMDSNWCKETGITGGKMFKMDEKGLYDPVAYIINDEAKIRDNECSVLIFHPGYLDQYVLDHSTFTLIRPMETEFLCSNKLKNWIIENNVEVVDFRNYRISKEN